MAGELFSWPNLHERMFSGREDWTRGRHHTRWTRIRPSYSRFIHEHIERKIWAATWQNQQVTVRPAKTQISLDIRPVWSESSLCTKWVAKDPSFFMRTATTLIRLGGCPGWSESSLGAHSFCWFCHVAAHMLLIYDNYVSTLTHIRATSWKNQQNDICAQRRLGSIDLRFLHAGSEASEQTGRMPRLIWVFALRTDHFVGFVVLWLICLVDSSIFANWTSPFSFSRCLLLFYFLFLILIEIPVDSDQTPRSAFL